MSDPRSDSYLLHLVQARPFFAELPYYLWGTVNYDSEGDCKNPLDRFWSWIELRHRETAAAISIESDGPAWSLRGTEPEAARAACFLQERCAARITQGAPSEQLGAWDHQTAWSRAEQVARAFVDDRLAPFATGHLFWGSWKWIGWFGTEYTWAGRWIMDAVVRSDPRAVHLCISWLRAGTFDASQSAVLCNALEQLTTRSHCSDAAWIEWYEREGEDRFPEPDMDAWHRDLQEIHGH